jgi:hypothetical protein
MKDATTTLTRAEVQQAGHQSGRQGRPTTTRSEVAGEVVLNQLPVHQPRQTNQRVLHVELLVQARTEHLGGLGGAGVGLHGLQNLQESARAIFVSLQISHHTSAEIALQINGLRVVQDGLRRLADPKLTAQVRHRHSHLRLLESCDDLLDRKPTLLHHVLR